MIVIREVDGTPILTFEVRGKTLCIDAVDEGMDYILEESEAQDIAVYILSNLGKDKTECN